MRTQVQTRAKGVSAMTRRCPKCDGSMSAGLIIDKDQGMRTPLSWLEGPIAKGWFGIKLQGKKPLDIETYRCNRCGFLENYAGA